MSATGTRCTSSSAERPTACRRYSCTAGRAADARRGTGRFFDPARYRVVLFDQRGCGRSAPRGELKHNTTAHLLADIERLRTHLGIERWLVFGGSWGASLGLAYCAAHKAACTGVILRGVFLTGRRDAAWFFDDVRQLLP